MDAFNLIRLGKADIILTGGSEAVISEAGVGGFNAMKAMSERNDDPKTASRPYDKDRDGFVLSEGAWVYVVETEETALKRGAPIYAEILGYGSTCDAHHRVRLDESGIEPARAMNIAIRDAGLAPEDIDYVNLHGTSTELNDRIETRALKLCLGKQAPAIPMSATKSMVGHPQGASGASGISAILYAMDQKQIPPTLNLDEPDPDCDLDYVPRVPRNRSVRYALANCIGFGSKNSALILGNPRHV